MSRISGYYQYPVSGRIFGNSYPVACRIPNLKKGRIIGRISGASLIHTITVVRGLCTDIRLLFQLLDKIHFKQFNYRYESEKYATKVR
jgi:hypothetical protein